MKKFVLPTIVFGFLASTMSCTSSDSLTNTNANGGAQAGTTGGLGGSPGNGGSPGSGGTGTVSGVGGTTGSGGSAKTETGGTGSGGHTDTHQARGDHPSRCCPTSLRPRSAPARATAQPARLKTNHQPSHIAW